ncbi:ABC transporter ATP-binding protein [uncultured Paracoccus sp.]|uniref:ABC transporter ATP-binding protein n=1 Tax=uncultured Paracoccus sp. TaxID=189685 RepID=UPI00261D30DB|nr:ABC transporter ATP-binding protein [uncultured Paracoccus sp.]
MPPIIEIDHLSKQYGSGTRALDDVSLTIDEGEIIALLGPNGAGKTTLISIICGLVVPTGGTVRVGGHDIRTDWRAARKLIGLVPQEIALEPFEKVINAVRFTRGLYGAAPDEAYLEQVLRSLALWDKRDARCRELSGGMKRRVLIAKALSHRPRVLFLDEPTAGVDVHLRREMWQVVRDLRASGVTIILTTHYLEEAEDMADRIGVINKGRLLLVRPTADLMGEFGRKQLTIELDAPLQHLPEDWAATGLSLSDGGRVLTYDYDTRAERTGIGRLLADLNARGLGVRDVATKQTSLEEVFISLVSDRAEVTADVEPSGADPQEAIIAAEGRA